MYKFLFVSLLLLGLTGTAQAQMSDQQVVDYVKNGISAGKDKNQIGRELVVRGVTQSQLERLKVQYEEGKAGDAGVPDVIAGSRQRKSPADDAVPGVADSLSAAPAAVAGRNPSRPVFGRNVFNRTNLTFEPNENVATPEHYKLGPGDEVIIDIWGANETNIRQQISPEGNIMVSQIGPLYLNGLTIREANEKVREVFARKYAGVAGDEPESQVRITLGQIRTIQINVMGEVAVPGTYRLSSFATVFHALYRAGGVTDIGSLRNIQVMRGGKQFAGLDVYGYLLEGKTTDDIRLQEGDVIVVPPYEALVSVEGKVKRPMYYEMKKGETLGTLIDYAGGFTGDAYSKEVRLVRRTGREYRLFNVDKSDYAGFELDDGDSVSVGTILNRFANRVEVRGAVYREGMYELGEDMNTVRQLIDRADGLKGDAFLARALLYREHEDLSIETVAVDLKGVINGTVPDISLRRNDVLEIASVRDLEEKGAFRIEGLVSRPGVYPFADNTTLEDLIIQAGGLLDGASTVRVDVARRLKDPKSLEASSALSEVFSFAVKDGFVIEGTPGFVLQPYDMVEVRKSPAYQVQRRVSIDGEVVFAGGYTLIQKNERISDLVKRAGGVTDDAYVRGGRLIREMNDEERAVRDEVVQLARRNSGADSLAVEKLQMNDRYTVGIELDKALANPGSDYDMVLREGDRLVVPEYVSTVKISGEIMKPNTVLFIKGEKLKYYISQAGGYGSRAKKGKAYIIYMNGTMSRVKGQGKARIEPGCEIVIPGKRARKGMSLAEIMGLTTSAASVGTMAASIANMAK
ncbi:SLBB domain-containing protein [uncultured Alistipes sp.]|jgi:protein involved in polysaccharide export with SLBB domain|uniref:SLBB domain-containing protein n=1 Tax=uncultured Alistipes sp. TaxID=538949 RepID=UPI0025EB9584|nr:SLBB domain-containing protein [uncultured Alistipes sp.]